MKSEFQFNEKSPLVYGSASYFNLSIIPVVENPSTILLITMRPPFAITSLAPQFAPAYNHRLLPIRQAAIGL